MYTNRYHRTKLLFPGPHGAPLDIFGGKLGLGSSATPVRSVSGVWHPSRTPWLPALLMIFACFPLPCWPLLAADKTDQPPSRVVQIGLSENAIEGYVNPEDVIATSKIWVTRVFTGKDTVEYANSVLFRDDTSIVAAIAKQEIDVIGLPTNEFIAIEKNLLANPEITYVHAGEVWVEYVLLVNRSGNLQNLAALRGKHIAITRGGQSAMTRLWGDTLLLSNGLGHMEGFFSEVREVQKPNQAIIPLFFGQLEAALVTRSAFELAVSLNPQIGQHLMVLATSPRLVPEVTCFSKFMDPALKARILSRVLKLQETPGGLQSFTIFKIDRFAPWKPEYADNVRTLLKQYADLTKSQVPRTQTTKISAGDK